MGADYYYTKKESNEQLKEIGETVNKENPDTFESKEIISLKNFDITNNLLINDYPGTTLDNDYKKEKFIKEDSTGEYYIVTNKITEIKSLLHTINKSINFEEKDQNQLYNELKILESLDHPNIIKIFGFYDEKETINIISELCSHGELFQEMLDNGPFNENYSAYVMYQLLSAVNFCHNNKIIHRDINPENILISERNKNCYPTIKLTNFNISRILNKDELLTKVIGSTYYIAPEVLNKCYNEKCDEWSCGIIMYILIFGRFPFVGNNDEEILEKINKGKYNLPSSCNISKNGLDLLQKLMEYKPEKRISAEDALNHSWFKDHKSKELINQIKDEKVIKDFINNFKHFKEYSIIQKTTLMYLVHNFPQMRDIVNACKLFNKIDNNNDGKINKEELLKGVQKYTGNEELEENVNFVFNNVDSNNNGLIEYEEFVCGAINKNIFINEKILKFAFKYFDKDGNGEITINELEKVFEKNIPDKNYTKNYLEAIMKDVDLDKDKKISYNEFCTIIKQMLK